MSIVEEWYICIELRQNPLAAELASVRVSESLARTLNPQKVQTLWGFAVNEGLIRNVWRRLLSQEPTINPDWAK